jgi:hypothetical protein
MGIYIAEKLTHFGQHARAAFYQLPFRTIGHLNVL